MFFVRRSNLEDVFPMTIRFLNNGGHGIDDMVGRVEVLERLTNGLMIVEGSIGQA